MMRQPLRCCVCLFLDPHERPDAWEDMALTVVNGHLVCIEHSVFAGPNLAMTAWANNELAHGRRRKGSGPSDERPRCPECGQLALSTRIPTGGRFTVYTHEGGAEHSVPIARMEGS
jgi:hypothetical protein